MARPKKPTPNADGYYSVTRVIGHDIKTGKAVKKTFRSKRSKADAENKANAYINGHTYADENFEKWALKWLWEYKEPFVRENTFEYTYRQTLENHIIPRFKAFKMSEITHSMIQEFLNSKRKLSLSLLNKIKICLNQIFKTAQANQIISFNPCVEINVSSTQEKSKTETYTEEEVQKIVNLTRLHRFGIYVHILIRMGLRVSELCGLRWEDIDFNNGTMSIKRACTDVNGRAVIGEPKSATSVRTIPIPHDLLEELKNERKKGYVVISASNKLVTPRTFTKKRYDVFFEEFGIKRLSPKQMRHTVGTLLYERCHDIYAVKSFLGHSSITVTSNIYVHSNPNDLRNQLFGESK